MGHLAALPEHLPTSFDMPILTFIVPAPNGCNLRCPFCYIDRRNEAARSLDLKPENYENFIEQAARRGEIGAICIQGYEPLLLESMPYTRSILATGRRLGIPTSLVTNGTYLECWIEELAELRPGKVAVSLDAADPAIHDRSRGKIGAFEDALRGLRLAADNPDLQPVLVLASILMPQKHQRLMGMPELAADLNVDHWVVTILQEVGKEEIGGPVGDRRRIFEDLCTLKCEAEKHGVNFIVDDEFCTLSEESIDCDVIDINALHIRRLARPSDTLRLLPTGQCSVGLEILKEVRPDTPRWVPREVDAADFIRAVQPNTGWELSIRRGAC